MFDFVLQIFGNPFYSVLSMPGINNKFKTSSHMKMWMEPNSCVAATMLTPSTKED